MCIIIVFFEHGIAKTLGATKTKYGFHSPLKWYRTLNVKLYWQRSQQLIFAEKKKLYQACFATRFAQQMIKILKK